MRQVKNPAKSMSGPGRSAPRPRNTANFEAGRQQSVFFAAILAISGFAAKVALGSTIHKHAQAFSHGPGTTKLSGNLRTPADSSFAHDATLAHRSNIDPL